MIQSLTEMAPQENHTRSRDANPIRTARGGSEGERRHLLDLLRGDSGGRGHRRRLRLHGHRLLHPFFCWLWYLGVAGLWVLEGLESWGSAQGWGVEASATASQSDCVTSWLKCGTCDPKKKTCCTRVKWKYSVPKQGSFTLSKIQMMSSQVGLTRIDDLRAGQK